MERAWGEGQRPQGRQRLLFKVWEEEAETIKIDPRPGRAKIRRALCCWRVEVGYMQESGRGRGDIYQVPSAIEEDVPRKNNGWGH